MRFDAETRAAVLKQDAVQRYFHLEDSDKQGVDTLFKVMLRFKSVNDWECRMEQKTDFLQKQICQLQDTVRDIQRNGPRARDLDDRT